MNGLLFVRAKNKREGLPIRGYPAVKRDDGLPVGPKPGGEIGDILGGKAEGDGIIHE